MALGRWNRMLNRWRARRALRRGLGIWYHHEYAAGALGRTYRVSGVDPGRSEKILRTLASEGLLGSADVQRPRLATFSDLARFHSPAYLEDSTRAEVLGHVFGLEPELVDVEALVRAQRRAVGGTVAAALAAAWGEARIAVNLGGGFHHAEPEQGGGFCVYNDVAVAIGRLRAEGYDSPIAVVDLDYHQGNGNTIGFAQDPTVLTFSIHGSAWVHVEAASDVSIQLPSGTDDDAYRACLERELPRALEAHRPRLVFYLAGNDVLGGDKLGAWSLSPAGALARDRRVVECATSLGASLVVTLAGGYSDQAWLTSADFVRWLLTGQAEARRVRDVDLPIDVGRIAPTLDPQDLRRSDEPYSFALREEDILDALGPQKHNPYLLDFYTRSGIEFGLERYGFLDKLRAKGFFEPRVSIDTVDRARQIIRIHGQKPEGSPPHLLVEAVLRKLTVPRAEGIEGEGALELLSVEWLLLQDPTRDFTLDRPRLPGQDHPGLGVGADVMALLAQMSRRLDLEGLIHHPSHYHIAFVSRPQFHFLDPRAEGRFLALVKVLEGWDLAQATQLVAKGDLRLRDGSAVSWEPSGFVLPVSERLQRYLASQAYLRASERACDELLRAGLHAGTGSPSPRADSAASRFR
jgi:acetoin utilization deacetylase AcuC-like enzyme